MLHILWMLLKIILIVLGIILGLVVLALLLVLFCPVRYRAEAEKGSEPLKQARVTLSVSWIFHGIWLRLFLREGNFRQDVRILGIPVAKLLTKKKKAPAMESEEKEQEELPEPEEISEQADIEETDREEESFLKEDLLEEEPREPADTAEETKGGGFRNLWNKIASFWEKLREIPRRIMDGIRKFALTLRNSYDKIDWWKAFLSHPRTQEALALVKTETAGILRHVFPTRIWGRVTFGSEDPSVTGTVLAALGITMPFHKNCIEIDPVFDGTNILEGNVQLKGRIYGCVLLKAAVEIYFNKNVKYVIRRWKHKEG